MSKCAHCLSGDCRKHPLLDHGERHDEILKQSNLIKNSYQQSSINQLLREKISKLEKEQHYDQMDDIEHRKQLEKEREKLLSNSNKRKFNSEEYNSSGLNPSVLATMIDSSDEDDDDDDSQINKSKKHKKKDKKNKKKDKKSKHKHKKDSS